MRPTRRAWRRCITASTKCWVKSANCAVKSTISNAMKLELKRSILSVLNACDGVPAPEVALLTAVRIHAQPEQPTESDILDALGDIERKRFAAAVTDELTGERTW